MGMRWAYGPGGDFLDQAKGLSGVAEWGGGFRWAEPPGRRRNFQKMFIKKPMENYHFMQIYENFVKMSRIFGENLGKISKYSFIPLFPLWVHLSPSTSQPQPPQSITPRPQLALF